MGRQRGPGIDGAAQGVAVEVGVTEGQDHAAGDAFFDEGHGAFDLWPPSRLFTGVGEITVRALEAQPPLPPLPEAEAHASRTAATDEARMRLQRTYVDHFSKQRDKPAPYTFGHMAEDALYVGVAVVAFAALKSGCWLLLASAAVLWR